MDKNNNIGFVNLNNKAELAGRICSEIVANTAIDECVCLHFTVECPRISKINDYINVLVPTEKAFNLSLSNGAFVRINGQFRSYNNSSGIGSRLILALFADDIVLLDEKAYTESGQCNSVFLKGNICKPVIYRKTPLGREISDILLAVSRSNYRSDYIPTILWGVNAKASELLEVGCKIEVSGRMQSREYTKSTDGGDVIRRAYEISASKFSNIYIS